MFLKLANIFYLVLFCIVSSIPLLIPTNVEPLNQRVGRGNLNFLNFVHFSNEIRKFGGGIGILI